MLIYNGLYKGTVTRSLAKGVRFQQAAELWNEGRLFRKRKIIEFFLDPL